ncbi:MAG TPA: penicillin-binding protein 2 [Symbiobacteriaceae bacterium]|nr:penicillin-binding protein 2 [Symbiobacteriaceae bacterium]
MEKRKDPVQRRAAFMVAIAMVTVAALTGQLANMTLLHQDTFLAEAEEQRTRSLPIYAPRGLIYDRNMVPLVSNRPSHSVLIRYPYYKQQDVLQRVSTILNVPLTDIEQKIAQKGYRYYEPVRVKDNITQEQYAAIVERKNEMPGVEVQSQPVREYPYKEMAAHTLGYVNQVSQEQIDTAHEHKYIPGELVGAKGLEAYYDDYLRGKPGIRQVEINNYFQPLGEVQATEPKPGNSIVLTIDAGLQQVAERALEWDMWRIRNTIIGDGPWPHAKAGAVVVMDVQTGAVLALASKPGFDPNLFARGITESEYKRLQDPVLTPEVHRAIQTAYQPGSTWKMMTSAAALQNGVVGPYEKIFCNGVYDKLGHPKCWLKGGHGWNDTVLALQNSCDIYYYEMGYRLGIDRLVSMAKQFGFGSKTGIDLGGENPGMLPDEVNRLKLWKEQHNDEWGPGHTISAAIGQIVNVTPLQLARYAATLGNHGKVMKPYLVQKVVDPEGRTIKEFGPEQTGQVKVDQFYLDLILKGMMAVNGPTGTSDYALYQVPGMKTAGKTGTAEYPPWDDYGFFVELAPADNPKIAIAVAIEQAGHGGSTAAVARTIESAYFNIKLPGYDPASVPDAYPNDPAKLRSQFKVVGTGQ